jgi:hypothetical protein
MLCFQVEALILKKFPAKEVHMRKIVALILLCTIMFCSKGWTENLTSGPFEGVYSGMATVTYGTAPVCGKDGVMTVTIKDGKFEYSYTPAAISKYIVRPDGTFSYEVVGGRGGRHYSTTGKIRGGILEVDFVYNSDSFGPQCAYHWSLKRM